VGVYGELPAAPYPSIVGRVPCWPSCRTYLFPVAERHPMSRPQTREDVPGSDPLSRYRPNAAARRWSPCAPTPCAYIFRHQLYARPLMSLRHRRALASRLLVSIAQPGRRFDRRSMRSGFTGSWAWSSRESSSSPPICRSSGGRLTGVTADVPRRRRAAARAPVDSSPSTHGRVVPGHATSSTWATSRFPTSGAGLYPGARVARGILGAGAAYGGASRAGDSARDWSARSATRSGTGSRRCGGDRRFSPTPDFPRRGSVAGLAGPRVPSMSRPSGSTTSRNPPSSSARSPLYCRISETGPDGPSAASSTGSAASAPGARLPVPPELICAPARRAPARALAPDVLKDQSGSRSQILLALTIRSPRWWGLRLVLCPGRFGTLAGRALVCGRAARRSSAPAGSCYRHGVSWTRLLAATGEPRPRTGAQDPGRTTATCCGCRSRCGGQLRDRSRLVIGIGTDFTRDTVLPTTRLPGSAAVPLPRARGQAARLPKLWKHHAAPARATRINVSCAERASRGWAATAGRSRRSGSSPSASAA